MSENDKTTGDDNDVREGDHREGVGGMRVRVELKMRTLRTAYRLVSRGPVT